MFLKMLEHEGRNWTVELRAVPETEGLGTLEFSFTNSVAGGQRVRLRWQVTGQALQVLSQQGADVSDEVLRRQLKLALAETRTIDTNAAGS